MPIRPSDVVPDTNMSVSGSSTPAFDVQRQSLAQLVPPKSVFKKDNIETRRSGFLVMIHQVRYLSIGADPLDMFRS